MSIVRYLTYYFLFILVFGLVLYKFTFNALAVNSATVTATVTMQEVAISVSDGSINYGVMGSGTSKSTIVSDLNDAQGVGNTGNVAEDFNVKGQDSTGWTLQSTAGANQYAHKFCINSCNTPPTNYTALTTNYQLLASNVGVGTSQLVNFQILAPTSSNTFAAQQVDVLVQAVAH